jgi:ABC-type polysaccharide/polyol phosphate export permease
MIKFLFFDICLGLVLIKILSRLYNTSLQNTLTGYLISWIFDKQPISLIYLLLYAILLSIFCSFIGMVFTIIQSLLYQNVSIIKIVLFF